MKAYKSKWIITASIEGKQILEDSALIIDEGRIVDIIPQTEIVEEDFDEVIDYGNSVITPGFINLGCQPQYNHVLSNDKKKFKIKKLFINIWQFFSMLGTPITSYPMYLSNVEKEYCCMNKKEKTESFSEGVNNLLLNGVTCFAQVSKEDMYFELLNDLPQKTYLFYETYADTYRKTKKEFFKLKKKFKKLLKHKSDNTFLGVYPNSILNIHKKFWKIISQYTRQKNLLLMTEIMESQEEFDWFKYGKSDFDLYNNFLGLKKIPLKNAEPVEYLSDLKVLSKNVIVRNCNFLDEKGMEKLSKAKVQFAYSPKFDDKLFEKKYEFLKILKYFPQKIGFSTGFLTSKNYNLLDELFYSKAILPLEEQIKYITIYPAKILRLDTITGSLDKGKDADFNVFKLKNRENPNNLKENNIPFAVFIKGEKLVNNYKIL